VTLTVPVRTAVVVTPAPPGVHGLGGAAGAMLDGLRLHGVDARPAGILPASRRRLRRVVASRPLRRCAPLVREVDRICVRRAVPAGWDLSYAMPGCLPGSAFGLRVLHQATEHPAVVLEATRTARARAGGGRGFMTGLEARRLVGELARADIVRVESTAVAAQLTARGVDARRVVQAYPGVDLERFRPAPRDDRLHVAFVGALALWKGADVLVELERRLQPSAVVEVVGGPVCPWSRRLLERARFRYADDVPAVMATSHYLVLPSVTDGFGYVVLEALASGCVPFVSPHAGAAEVVRRLDPRLVQPPARFAERVPELMRTLPFEDLSRRARSLAGEFEYQAMARVSAARVLAAASAVEATSS
jgi:glycosyltransferase involved in cell wall biosynthesis